MSSRTALVVLSLAPVVVPAVALLTVQTIVAPYIGAASTATRTFLKKDPEDKTTASSSSSSVTATAADTPPPHSLPEAVTAPDAPYVVTCERLVSRPVPVAVAEDAVGAEKEPAALLTAYLRGTMEAFTWTPLGLFLRSFVKDPARRPYFDADVVRGLTFAVGDLASPVHEVTYRGDSGDGGDGSDASRVELTFTTVPDLPQLAMHSILVAEVVRSGSDVVFISETWMWRHAQTEKPAMLESAFGRRVHRLVGGWLLFKGTKAVTKK